MSEKRTPIDRVAELEQALSDVIRGFEIFVAIKGGGPGDYVIDDARSTLENKLTEEELAAGQPESGELDDFETKFAGMTEEEQVAAMAKEMADMMKQVRAELDSVLDGQKIESVVMVDPISGKAYDVETGKPVDLNAPPAKKTQDSVKFPTNVDTTKIDRSQIPPEAANVRERK